MDIRGIGYLGFESPNIAAWRSYGPEVLGLGVATAPEDEPDSLYLRLDDRRYRFAFQPGPIDRLTYIGWEAIGRLAFEDGLRKLEADPFEPNPERLSIWGQEQVGPILGSSVRAAEELQPPRA
jgi:hypothetical protein